MLLVHVMLLANIMKEDPYQTLNIVNAYVLLSSNFQQRRRIVARISFLLVPFLGDKYISKNHKCMEPVNFTLLIASSVFPLKKNNEHCRPEKQS